MQGQILLSVIVGILVYLGLLIIGVPYALLLAVFTALAEIIPIFGSLMAGTVAIVVAYSSGGVALAVIVLGLFIVVNQFESNLIYPLIVKKVVGVPPLLVIVALIAGYTLAGFLGALLSVPVSAVLLEIISDFDKPNAALNIKTRNEKNFLSHYDASVCERRPHIGFALEIVQADALARAWRFAGDEVFFSTGTDEHGQKIFEAAKKVGRKVKNTSDHTQQNLKN